MLLVTSIMALFEPHDIIFASKETVLELNGCMIEAFPSNHLDAYRALDNPKFILLDEQIFSENQNRKMSVMYQKDTLQKSDPYIVMVSSPNAPGGLFEKIEKEPEQTCI